MTSTKRDARYNSVKHGVFAKILLSGDHFGNERENYVALNSALRLSIRPIDGLEELLVEKLALLYVRLTRLYKADLKIAPKMFDRVSQLLGPGQPSIKAKWISTEDQVLVVQRDPTSESITRYESNLERQIARSLDELRSWREMRRDQVRPSLPMSESKLPEAEHEGLS
jgi:hypothetical protein